MADDLRIEVEEAPDGAVVRVHGEVDMDTAPALRECLNALTGRVVVDLSETTFLDSSGMSVLVTQRNRLIGVGGDLSLRAPRHLVLRALEITGLDRLIEKTEP
jgi:anti-sigma B factor antagonist